MNKLLLSTLLSSTIVFASIVKAAENNIPNPLPPHEQLQMGRHHKGFDKDFHEKLAKKMADELNLTDEQKKQAKKIRADGHEKIKPLMDEMKELRQKIDTERKANMEKFEEILTPEQKTKFNELKKDKPFGKEFDRSFHKKGKPDKFMRGMHKK